MKRLPPASQYIYQMCLETFVFINALYKYSSRMHAG